MGSEAVGEGVLKPRGPDVVERGEVWGSTTKMLTAPAVLQLVEKNQVRFWLQRMCQSGYELQCTGTFKVAGDINSNLENGGSQ